MQRCGLISKVLLQVKDTICELFVKRKELLPCFGFHSHRDMILAVEMNVKTHSSFPSPVIIIYPHTKPLYIVNLYYIDI